jgi:hypothetical protein
MHLATVILMHAVITVIAGCDRDSKTDGSPEAPSEAPTVVYRSPDGQVLSQDELKSVTGKFNYEIIGAEQIPALTHQSPANRTQLPTIDHRRDAVSDRSFGKSETNSETTSSLWLKLFRNKLCGDK